MGTLHSIPVTEESQIGEARRVAARAAMEIGLDAEQQAAVSLVASELATNLARHARGGELLVQGSAHGEPTLDLLSVDCGPGMADVARCMGDGFSTAGSSGTGLGAVRRRSSEFDVYSRVGQGTVVFSRTRATESAPAPSFFVWGGVCIPAPGEDLCGDAFRVVARNGDVAVMVSDGLGHGELAHAASEVALAAFEAAVGMPPRTQLERAHTALVATRGSALAVARGSSKTSKLVYAGIGNIAGTLVGGARSQGLVSHNGIVGVQMRTVHEFEYAWPAGTTLILHSDGVQSRWSLDPYPGLLARHPTLVAAVLYRDFRRGRDDVTVVVVKTRP